MKPIRFHPIASLLTSGAAALYALPALADDGLPQLNTALYPEQLFWLVISFGMLYLLMRFIAIPGVESAQGKRKKVIDSALGDARTANEQAKDMAVQINKALTEARAKANATIGTIKSEASELAAKQQEAQSKQLHARLREAEVAIAAKRDAALKDVESTAAGLAAAIVESVSSMKVKA